MAYRLEPFIASRAYDPEADILPTWTGKLRVHYQVFNTAHSLWLCPVWSMDDSTHGAPTQFPTVLSIR